MVLSLGEMLPVAGVRVEEWEAYGERRPCRMDRTEKDKFCKGGGGEGMGTLAKPNCRQDAEDPL